MSHPPQKFELGDSVDVTDSGGVRGQIQHIKYGSSDPKDGTVEPNKYKVQGRYWNENSLEKSGDYTKDHPFYKNW